MRNDLSFKRSARRLVILSGLMVLLPGRFLIPGSGQADSLTDGMREMMLQIEDDDNPDITDYLGQGDAYGVNDSGVIMGKGSMPPAGRNPRKGSGCAGSGRIETGPAVRRNAPTGFKFRLPQLGFLERPDGGHHLVEVWVGAFRFFNTGDGFFEHYAGVRDPVAFGEALEIEF